MALGHLHLLDCSEEEGIKDYQGEEMQVPSVHSLRSVEILTTKGANPGEKTGGRRKLHYRKCGKSSTVVKGHSWYVEDEESHLTGALF